MKYLILASLFLFSISVSFAFPTVILKNSAITTTELPASNITNGTFGIGNYWFQNNVTLTQYLTTGTVCTGTDVLSTTPTGQLQCVGAGGYEFGGVTGLTLGVNVTWNGISGLDLTNTTWNGLTIGQSNITGITIPAKNVTNGTFPSGLYKFPLNITVNGTIFLNGSTGMYTLEPSPNGIAGKDIIIKGGDTTGYYTKGGDVYLMTGTGTEGAPTSIFFCTNGSYTSSPPALSPAFCQSTIRQVLTQPYAGQAIGFGTLTPKANFHLTNTTSFNTAFLLDASVTSYGQVYATAYGMKINPTFLSTPFRINESIALFVNGSGNFVTNRSYGLYVDTPQSGIYGAPENSYAAVFMQGSVGIGIAQPTSKLHISGTTDSYTAPSNMLMNVDGTAAIKTLYVNTDYRSLQYSIDIGGSGGGSDGSPNGTYRYAGMIGGYNYYFNGTTGFYLFQRSSYWRIHKTLYSLAAPTWYALSTAPTPEGLTFTAATYTGSPTTTAGNITMYNAQLMVNGSANLLALNVNNSLYVNTTTSHVGIGTIEPHEKLTVLGTSLFNGTIRTILNGTGDGFACIRANGTIYRSETTCVP